MECYASSTSHCILCFGEKAEASGYQRSLETSFMRERCGETFWRGNMNGQRAKTKLLTSPSTTMSHKVGILQKLNKETFQEGDW